MPGEDQERFEDYLELEQYIEELQAGHVAHPPTELTPSQARIYRMAALFRSASPEGAELRPEFVAQLQARLEQELEEKQSVPTQPLPVVREKKPWQILKKPGRVSRRALLTGGAAAAASLVVGAGIERVAEPVANDNTQKQLGCNGSSHTTGCTHYLALCDHSRSASGCSSTLHYRCDHRLCHTWG